MEIKNAWELISHRAGFTLEVNEHGFNEEWLLRGCSTEVEAAVQLCNGSSWLGRCVEQAEIITIHLVVIVLDDLVIHVTCLLLA
jgi:hypothetical protein